MNKHTILGVSGSYRSKVTPDHFISTIDQINRNGGLDDFIEKFGRDQIYSNSDLALMAGLHGARMNKMSIDVVNLKHHIKNDRIVDKDGLKKKVAKASGILISTPVYFGDRSYLVDEFIRLMRRESLLRHKIVGCSSVGAKRNGGQETTNIYVLKEASDSGAFIVGNGPPTSQYGGTVWAGNEGAIREDNWGIHTSQGTGHRVSEAVKLLHGAQRSKSRGPLRIALWVVSDTNHKVTKEIDKLITYADDNAPGHYTWDIIDFTNFKIMSCMACPVCPHHKGRKSLYKCIIAKDDFARQYSRLVNTDAILICASTEDRLQRRKYVYQKVLERTRCIRRDNFLLSNKPITSLTLESLPRMSLFSLKVMTSFLRHNTIIAPPIRRYLFHGDPINDIEDEFDDFLTTANRITASTDNSDAKQNLTYIPIGY